MGHTEKTGRAGGANELNPIDSLLFFHKSIRVALDALDALAAVARIGTTESVRAQALLDFFIGPMRWHDLDERHCLITPLLQTEKSGPAIETLEAARQEHDEIGHIVDGLVVHLREVAVHQHLPDATLLTAGAARLRGVMEPHLRREETQLFPLARSVFSPADLTRMREEMATRRKERERGAHV